MQTLNAVGTALALVIAMTASCSIDAAADAEAGTAGAVADSSLDATLRTLVEAATRGNCAAIAPLVSFPVEYWSAAYLHGTRDVVINDAATFVADCDRYIDSTTRGGVGHAERATLNDGRVILTWDDENASSTFELAPAAKGTYRIVRFSRAAR